MPQVQCTQGQGISLYCCISQAVTCSVEMGRGVGEMLLLVAGAYINQVG